MRETNTTNCVLTKNTDCMSCSVPMQQCAPCLNSPLDKLLAAPLAVCYCSLTMYCTTGSMVPQWPNANICHVRNTIRPQCCSSASSLIVSYWGEWSAVTACQHKQSEGRELDRVKKQKLYEMEPEGSVEWSKQTAIVKLRTTPCHFGTRQRLQHPNR